MPMMWKVTEHPYEDGVLVPGEPFVFLTDDDGDAFVLCRELIEVPSDPSKATEMIGTVPSPDQTSYHLDS